MTATAEQITIGPQPGPQTAFVSNNCDVCFYGGSAWGGKTYGLLLIPYFHVDDPNFGAVIFRRTLEEVKDEGGLWDESSDLYGMTGATPKSSKYSWIFPSGAKVRFAHMEYEKDRFRWKGSQIPFIGFDQLETFTEKQFFYMISRNRSTTAAVWPYIRATINPDPDSWLREFLSWWIDDVTGYPIKERSGVVRWFRRRGDGIEWHDEPGPNRLSFTFIPASPYDNKIGMARDPDYIPLKLENLLEVERRRLLEGDWNARATAGSYVRREHFDGKFIDVAPVAGRTVRGWDLAATSEEETKTASKTAGVKMRLMENGWVVVLDVVARRAGVHEVHGLIRSTVEMDGNKTIQDFPQDPGQAGKDQKSSIALDLREFGCPVFFSPETGSKATRATPFCTQVQAGTVLLVRAPWNEAYIRSLENFDGTKSCRSDEMDGSSRAFSRLVLQPKKRAGAWGRGTNRGTMRRG